MRASFVLLGHLCLAVGAIGVFVPLLPTTPFVLLAAFCYSKGSERLHRWITAHPRFGRSILDWQRHGVIRPRAKWVSTALIVASLSYPILFKDLPIVAKCAAMLVGIAVLTFIHTRPSAEAGHRGRHLRIPFPSLDRRRLDSSAASLSIRLRRDTLKASDRRRSSE